MDFQLQSNSELRSTSKWKEQSMHVLCDFALRTYIYSSLALSSYRCLSH